MTNTIKNTIVIVLASVILSFALQTTASAAGMGNDRCVHNYYDARPCLSSIKKWRAWADYHGLERDHQSAAVFQAYAEYNYTVGDKLFAALKGVDVEQVKGIGLQVVQLVEGFVHMPADLTPEQAAMIAEVSDWY
jgi:hypothetical protein